jgi:hypothetical protein
MSTLDDLYYSRPLPPGSKCIRVLDVLAPPTSSDSDPDRHGIEGVFRVVDLEDHPYFTALSYVWGPPSSSSHHIICGGHKIALTTNGHSGLRHLQRKLGSFTIWIDAICIKQDDDIEKAQQIPLMGDIYSEAHTVFIWLGKGNARTDRAMSWLGSAGLHEYHFGKSNFRAVSRPFKAAWAVYWSRWNKTRNPIPLDCKIGTKRRFASSANI